MSERGIASYREDLTNPERGYVVVPGFVSGEDVERYREECRRFLRTCKRIYRQMRRRDLPDYAKPDLRLPDGRFRLADARNPETDITRIFQFLHNAHSDATQRLFTSVLSLRDEIERCWLEDESYRSEAGRLLDYVQVTAMLRNSSGVSRHRDCRYDLPFPLLQPLVLLSEPNLDYEGGDLILHTRRGGPVRLQAERGMSKGDLLLFDKSLDHEVEPSKQLTDIGRWSVVIGARGPATGYLDRYRYGAFFVERIKPRLRQVLELLSTGSRLQSGRRTPSDTRRGGSGVVIRSLSNDELAAGITEPSAAKRLPRSDAEAAEGEAQVDPLAGCR